MNSFKISRIVLAQIEELARRGFPYEICGFLAGPTPGQGRAAKPARNIARQRQVEYNIAPEETLQTLLALEAADQRITGVYHSHPRYPARPSATDLHLADLPDAAYLITSVQESSDGYLHCRTLAWNIVNQQPVELELLIVE
jgi:proteasome lid subunit RPN8/RPN11